MNMTELKLNRNEFDVYVRADIVQAIADGKYIADPSNEHKKWIDIHRGDGIHGRSRRNLYAGNLWGSAFHGIGEL